jgi:hypothetical protein
MHPLITAYFLATLAIAVPTCVYVSWISALCLLGTGNFSLIAGGGLKAALWWGDRGQKIAAPIIAGILMSMLSHFTMPYFSVHLSSLALTGQEWGWLGVAIGFLFTDQKLAGVRPKGIDARFLSPRPGQEVCVSPLEYADVLHEYRTVATRMFEETREGHQPAKIDLQPLLTRMRSTEILLNRPLIAHYDGEQAYQFPDPLGCIRVKRTIDGVVSALFISAELPTISAWDHGLYGRNFVLVTTDDELSEALADIEADESTSINVPPGIRVRREGENLIANCLIYSETEGLMDLSIQIGANGNVSKGSPVNVLKPAGRVLY